MAQKKVKVVKKAKIVKKKKGPAMKISRIGRHTEGITDLHITDNDIQEVQNILKNREQKVNFALDSISIKTLSLQDITTLIELREVELKQLKYELVSRLI